MMWAIHKHTFAAPWWDEWYTAFLVRGFEQGTLTPHDIWAFHWNTHRIVIPRVVDLILIELTHWNRQVELFFDLACGVASAAIIVWCLWLSARSWSLIVALLVPLSILLFSMASYYDWLLPFQIAFIASVLGVAITMVAVIRQPVGWRGWTVAVTGAMIATLSSAGGLLVWFVFVPSMYRSGWRRLLAWCAIATVTWAAYLHGFVQPNPRPTLHNFIDFVLDNLGAPVASPSYWLSERIGLASLVVMAIVLAVRWQLHRTLWDVIVWLELALFALANAMMTADGRAWVGVWPALYSRYMIFSALWWVALLVIVGLTIRDLLRGRDAFGTLGRPGHPWAARLAIVAGTLAIVAVTVGALQADVAGFRAGIAWQDGLRAHEACVTHFETARDSCLGIWFWDKGQLLDTAAYMRAHHLANFFYTDQP